MAPRTGVQTLESGGIADPSLWNSFVGGHSPSTNESSRKALHGPILEDVLNRSGNTPLEASVINLTSESASILAHHASRLSELGLTCDLDNLRALKDAPEMTMLTKLCLTTRHYDENSEPVHFDIASKAPRLTHVVLKTKCVFVNVPHFIILPWSQITYLELELGPTNYRYIIDILSQCLHLVSFTDGCRDNPYRISPNYVLQRRTPSSIYVFPRLTFLAIRSPLAILSYLQCPALQTFALRGSFQDDAFTETDWEDFHAFMDTSQCTLQEVAFIPENYMHAHRSAHLQKLLMFVSYVPRVEIDISASPLIGLKGIIDREDNVIAFPEVQILTLKANASLLDPKPQHLSGPVLQQNVEDELIVAVESRWRVPVGAPMLRMARIELSMTIRGSRYDDTVDRDVKVLHEKLKGTELLQKMEILKDEGLDVSITVCVRWPVYVFCILPFMRVLILFPARCYENLIVKESTMRCL
ncbi:hypothetical protein BDZ89DRAFT_604466 [Hymenopellis radicata]|nr:hypothetical protein BDZ89DRAFT_604466 [Hymenopellis radicata]